MAGCQRGFGGEWQRAGERFELAVDFGVEMAGAVAIGLIFDGVAAKPRDSGATLSSSEA